MQHAARVVALLVAAAGLTDGLQVRPALRQSHALVAASAQRSAPGGATMGLLPSFLTDAQVTSALSKPCPHSNSALDLYPVLCNVLCPILTRSSTLTSVHITVGAQGKVDAQRVKSAARVHDYFNIGATSVMSYMVIAARFKGGAVCQHGHSAPLGSAPARFLRLLRARLAALGSPALPGRGSATGRPAAASGARISRLQSRPFYRL